MRLIHDVAKSARRNHGNLLSATFGSIYRSTDFRGSAEELWLHTLRRRSRKIRRTGNGLRSLPLISFHNLESSILAQSALRRHAPKRWAPYARKRTYSVVRGRPAMGLPTAISCGHGGR